LLIQNNSLLVWRYNVFVDAIFNREGRVKNTYFVIKNCAYKRMA